MKRNNIRYTIQLFITILSCFAIVPFSKAQYIEQYPISASNANKLLEIENYQEAVRQFELLLEEEPNNIEYKFLLGRSYTYSFINQEKGLKLLKEVSESSNKPDNVDRHLAMAYFKNYLFQDAIEIFESLKSSATTEEEKKEYGAWILQCEQSTKMQSSPVDVTFENLGKEVNSNAPDYLPVVASDESQVIFTTRRDGVVGNLYDYGGYRTADIYIANNGSKKYRKSRSIGSPNTYGNEQSAGKSENGEFMIYNVNSEEHFNNLFVSEKGRRSYMPPKVFDSDIVNARSNEMGGSLTNDGKKLYFCSDRDGGLGGFDIYWVQRLPTGVWSEPKNLGPPINTDKDEQYPMLMNDGQSLYFSSNGHTGMGGMDLFKSELNEESGNWMAPKNLGYPVNTVNDDMNISFAKNERFAYKADKRPDSYGDLDIYRLTFHYKKEEYTLVQGKVMNADSSIVETDVLVEIFDRDEEYLYGSYLMNKSSGKFNAILPPGKYRIEILDTVGYKDYEKKFNVQGKNYFKAMKKLSIVLDPN